MKFHYKQKFWIEKNFNQYRELLFHSSTKFAQLSSIFKGMNENNQNSTNIRQFFQVILTIFTLNISGFYRIFKKL
jgi:hypothetical protein